MIYMPLNTPLRFDLIKSIIEHSTHVKPGETVDPSTSNALREAGVALVTTHIEQLSMLELVTDPFPLFGEKGGMWIGYQLTDKGRQSAASEEELRYAVKELIGGPKGEVSEAVHSLSNECAKARINPDYRDSFLKTLDEIGICFDAECYISVMALCGVILEACLREILIRHDIEVDKNWMIGKLIREIKQQVPDEYVDPNLLGISNIINRSRIIVLHEQSREYIPVPSRDQAIMVIFAMRDVVRRNLSHQSLPTNETGVNAGSPR